MAKEAKGKNSTVFYHDWLDIFADLTAAEVGEITLALLKFDASGEEPHFTDRAMKLVFKQLKATVSRNREAYDEKCEKNRERIAKYWEEQKTKENGRKPTYSNGTDTDSDTDSDTDTDSDSGSGSDTDNDNDAIQPHHLPELNSAAIDLIIHHWNARTITRPIQKFGPVSARANNVRLCINGDFDQFLDTIKHLDEQQFLMKQFMDKGRQITFDWFVKPENYQKVAEGNYAEEWKEAESDGYSVDW